MSKTATKQAKKAAARKAPATRAKAHKPARPVAAKAKATRPAAKAAKPQAKVHKPAAKAVAKAPTKPVASKAPAKAAAPAAKVPARAAVPSAKAAGKQVAAPAPKAVASPPAKSSAPAPAKATEAKAASRKGSRGGNEKIEISLPASTPEDRQSQLKLLIARGKEQSYLTYAEVNDHLPSEIVDPEQIEGARSDVGDVGGPADIRRDRRRRGRPDARAHPGGP